MKFKGGYNVLLDGKPGGVVEVLPESDVLWLPLRSCRFTFSEISVSEGQRVHAGQILAKDPQHHSVPLLAPREGTVRLEKAEGHITLEEVTKSSEEPYHPSEHLLHVPKSLGSVGMKRYKLLMLGAWQFLHDAYTGALPDPFGTPQAVIVSAVCLDPFVARGDVQIHKRLSSFTRGLEHLQTLLEYQPIHLVLPDVDSEFASAVRETLRGYAWVNIVPLPMRYGLAHFAVLARALALKRDPTNPIWALGVGGVLAMDRALTLSRPCTVRIVSLGGPGVDRPTHLKAVPGYPLRAILDPRVSCSPARVINGGVLAGQEIGPAQVGLDTECEGLTVLPEHTEREPLGFLRPGWKRRSYSNCFMSMLRPAFRERFTTAVRGERRPCISCGFCEEVCPAGIMPHLIHKYLYQDEIEEVDKCRVDLCVGCGLCSFVCPSKLELRREFLQAQETVQRELRTEEASA